jgi:hypothetical protein
LFSIVTLDYTREKMAERFDHHLTKVRNNPELRNLTETQIQQMAKHRVASEFGMEGVGSGLPTFGKGE